MSDPSLKVLLWLFLQDGSRPDRAATPTSKSPRCSVASQPAVSPSSHLHKNNPLVSVVTAKLKQMCQLWPAAKMKSRGLFSSGSSVLLPYKSYVIKRTYLPKTGTKCSSLANLVDMFLSYTRSLPESKVVPCFLWSELQLWCCTVPGHVPDCAHNAGHSSTRHRGGEDTSHSHATGFHLRFNAC